MVRMVRHTINRSSRSGHIVAGMQVKGKGKGQSKGKPDGWTVLMQVLVNEQSIDPDPAVEIYGGQTTLLINTASQSMEIQADLQQNSEQLTVTVNYDSDAEATVVE